GGHRHHLDPAPVHAHAGGAGGPGRHPAGRPAAGAGGGANRSCLCGGVAMLLERLSNACGVSGDESGVRALLKEILAPRVDEMWTDPMGNLIVRKGSGPVRVMLDAHMDEVGFLVG